MLSKVHLMTQTLFNFTALPTTIMTVSIAVLAFVAGAAVMFFKILSDLVVVDLYIIGN